MSKLTITNLTGSPVHIGDIYYTIPANGSVVVERDASDLSGMVALQKAVTAGQVAASIAYETWETASGLVAAPGSVEARDLAPVAATAAAAVVQTIRKSFTAGVPGTADDVVIFAAGALPYKMRILDVVALVSTNIALSTLTVRDEAAGAGTAAAVLDSATTGRKMPDGSITASVVYTPGVTKGLFLRRSDRGVAGEVVLTVRQET